MPDKRTHRGAHPEDARLFDRSAWPALKAATADMALLLSKGYADKSTLKLVGDHFSLTGRQRIAVMRATCSDAALEHRRGIELGPAEVAGRELLIDGYNVLTSVEAALAGGVILACRDGCYRDMASVHGTYRKVQETVPAIELLGRAIGELGVAGCRWYLDSPVSNSGRLKKLMSETAAQSGWAWQVETVTNPDRVLCDSGGLVVSADSVILDGCRLWLNLARHVIDRFVPGPRVVDLSVS